ncbi:2OG-Fe(II) oxygenase [Alloalcanivorax xenomutans]|uniref:2OG-Fe(II) oxygenase n=1 Tax=Alloalcanivorax xenomutans TaxID=1094342 RepID=UPI003A806ED1
MTAPQRLERVDWPTVEQHLDDKGHAVIPGLLDAGECAGLTALYTESDRFRSRVVMARHGFGRGEYQYFAYPLPTLVDTLRRNLYPRLVPIANRWQARMGKDQRFPTEHDAYLAQCHGGGQCRPTPLLLRYRPGDYNCLHQDL